MAPVFGFTDNGEQTESDRGRSSPMAKAMAEPMHL
jgi:hypothetical protein